MRYITIATILIGSVQLYASQALGDVTGWMTPAQYEKHLNKLKAQNRLPTKIQCKGNKSTSRHNFARIRVTDAPNRAKLPWISQVNQFSSVTVTAGQRVLDKGRGLRRKIVSHQRFSVPGIAKAFTCHITHFERVK